MTLRPFTASKATCLSILDTSDSLIIGDQEISSRLILEITDFPQQTASDLIAATECGMVTHTQRMTEAGPTSMDELHVSQIPEAIRYVPNTHGCKTAEEAITLAHAIRNTGLSDWLKLEVTPNPKHYMSDGIETLKAAERLVKGGFTVLPYIHADPLLAKRLEDVGCATVMPLGSPIGSGKGLKTRDFIEMIVDEANVPVIVDAGIGTPFHATEAMQIGADAVIVHTAILNAKNPVLQASAFRS